MSAVVKHKVQNVITSFSINRLQHIIRDRPSKGIRGGRHLDT